MNKNVKVGLFVVIGIIVIVLGFFWATKFEFRKEGYTAIAHFPDVTGLKVGDRVRVYGVNKGRVEDIQFRKGYVEVTMLINEDVKIYADATASIEDVAMISGTKFLQLNPGTSETLFPEGEPITGSPSLGVSFAKVGQMGEELISLLTKEDVITSLKETLDTIKEILEENRRDTRKILRNVRDGTEGIDELKTKIDNVVMHTDSLLLQLGNESGTLAKLTNDNGALYEEAKSTLTEAKELFADIKANPRRYIKIF
jgi:phospholipid/cholesterol/gamma-HCH transport system substrate-binding protein